MQPLLDRLGVDFTPDTPVAEMSLAQRQLLEIVKALSLDARLVIMDEPTSSLTLTETDAADARSSPGSRPRGQRHLHLAPPQRGRALRRPRRRAARRRAWSASSTAARSRHDAMIRLMIGRDLKALYIPPAARAGASALEIVEVRTATYPEHAVNLAVRRGEILGLAGLVGSGRTELARAVFGIDRLLGGAVRLDGEPIVIALAARGHRRGASILVPEDRKRAGLLLDVSVAENISLPDLRFLFARPAWSSAARETAQCRAPETSGSTSGRRSVTTAVGTLSGGNQQKVVLAKWLAMEPRVIIFDEPTRGIDVGAKSEIYEMLRASRRFGRRHIDDLQRHGGGDRGQRSHRRDA